MCVIQRDDQTPKICPPPPPPRDREAKPQGSEGHHTHTHTEYRNATQCITFALLCGVEGNAQENEGHAHLSWRGLQGRRRASNQSTLNLSRHKSRSVFPQQPGTQIFYK